MSSTEQAQEPTMEEILASIRKIISDDTAESEQAEESAAPESDDVADEPEPEPEPEPVANQDDIDSLFDADEPEDEPEDDVLELTEVVEEPAEEPAADVMFDEGFADSELEEPAGSDEVAFVDIEEPPAPDPVEVPPPADSGLEDRLISETTDTAVATAFGQLASTLLTRSGNTRTLEELVQEMLRPMLKSWLDANLPTIVEELVRQEIERTARKAGR